MIRFQRTILFLSLVFCLVNCKNNTDNSADFNKIFSGYKNTIRNPDQIEEVIPSTDCTKIEIPKDISEATIDISNLIDSSFYIKLETTNESLIGNIDKLIFFDNKILVIEKLSRQSILLFKDDGKFIKKVGIKGHGPGEFFTIRDVTYDYTNEKILLLDDYGRKILYFDKEGNYLSYQKLFYYYTHFAVLQDCSIIASQITFLNSHLPSIARYSLLFLNKNQEIIGRSMPDFEEYPNNKLHGLHCFNCIGDYVLYKPVFSNTIYKISQGNKIDEYFKINLGNQDVLNEMHKDITIDDFVKLLNTNNFYYFNGPVFETRNYLYFKIQKGGDCFYSLKNRSLYYGNKYRINSDVNNIITMSSPISVNGDFFVNLIQPHRILYMSDQKKYSTGTQAVLRDLKENDNPVLFLYSLK